MDSQSLYDQSFASASFSVLHVGRCWQNDSLATFLVIFCCLYGTTRKLNTIVFHTVELSYVKVS